jgi:hypothetical protein
VDGGVVERPEEAIVGRAEGSGEVSKSVRTRMEPWTSGKSILTALTRNETSSTITIRDQLGRVLKIVSSTISACQDR